MRGPVAALSPRYLYISKALRGDKVLDVGCGYGPLGYMLYSVGFGGYLVGVDVFLPYLRKAKIFYGDVVQADARMLPFRDGAFSDAVCSEVVEHMDKHDGYLLLEELKRLAWNVVVTCPLGFNRHPEYDGNPFQEHKSAWYPRDFEKRGYEVAAWGRKIQLLIGKGYIFAQYPRLTVKLPNQRLSKVLGVMRRA